MNLCVCVSGCTWGAPLTTSKDKLQDQVWREGVRGLQPRGDGDSALVGEMMWRGSDKCGSSDLSWLVQRETLQSRSTRRVNTTQYEVKHTTARLNTLHLFPFLLAAPSLLLLPLPQFMRHRRKSKRTMRKDEEDKQGKEEKKK